MPVEFSTLTDFVSVADGMTADEFALAHPGAYFVAMGVLAVEMRGEDEEPRTFEMIRPMDAPKHASGGAAPLMGHVFVVASGSIGQHLSVGRDSSCDIMVPDTSVSSRHAQVTVDVGAVSIKDLGSRNGTSLNNRPLASGAVAEVEDGDLLTFGRFSFQYFGAHTFHAALRILA